MQVKIRKILRGAEAEKLILSFSSKNPKLELHEEYLIMKIAVMNKSPKVVFVPYTYNLLLENQNTNNKESHVYFRDDIELPQIGEWKKLVRLEWISSYSQKEGTICFLIPKDASLKRFYVFQYFLTFP